MGIIGDSPVRLREKSGYGGWVRGGVWSSGRQLVGKDGLGGCTGDDIELFATRNIIQLDVIELVKERHLYTAI